MAKAIANWHYYDKSGQKLGPVSVSALRALAQQGLITRETVIVNHTGRTAIAGEVPGLAFPEPTTPETVQPEVIPVPVTPPTEENVYGLSPLAADPFPSFGANPYAPASPADPFAASNDPFADAVSLANQAPTLWASQPVPQSVSSSLMDKLKTKPYIFGGIAGGAVLLSLIVGVWMMASSPSSRSTAEEQANATASSRSEEQTEEETFTAEEQAEIDKFCKEQGTDINLKGRDVTPLLRMAVTANTNVAVLKFLAEKGADVNVKNLNDFTLLHDAALNNVDVSIFKFLVENGVDINAKTSQIGTPLHLALQNNADIAVVKFLVSKGTDLKSKDYFGNTPLHIAARDSEDVEVVKFLVSQGADVHAETSDMAGLTPFDCATSRKDKKNSGEIVKYLESQGGTTLVQRVYDKAYGTDVHAKDKEGRTPLHNAAYDTKNIEVIKKLVTKGADVKAKSNDGGTPLHMSVLRGDTNVEILRLLIEQGAEINAPQNDGTTPLHFALQSKNNIDAIKFLVEHGANVNAKTETGMTPLHVAAMFIPNVEIFKLLVSKGAEVNAGDNDGDTPFLRAVQSSTSVDVLKFLVEQGAKVNDKNGATPLHFAALSNPNLDILKFLVEQGAEVNAKSNDGTTPLHYAARSNENVEVLKYLISRKAEANVKSNGGKTPLDYAMTREVTRKNTAEIIKFLTDMGGTTDLQVANARDENGNTALHLVAFKSNVEDVKMVVSMGGDVNAKNNAGDTPLHIAAMGNTDVEVVKFLVSQGADVKAVDKNGGTPLHKAAFNNENVEVLKYLVEHGANVNAKASNDVTPLDLAKKRKDKKDTDEIVRYLSGRGGVTETPSRPNAEPAATEREQPEKKNTFWFGRIINLKSDEFWWKNVQFRSERSAKEMARDMKDVFFVSSIEPCSSLDNTGLGYSHVVLVSFNGKRFKTEAELNQWIDKESPKTINLALYSSGDNYRKLQTGKIKSKELLAKEFAQKMERGNVDNDVRSKAISAIAQPFQGQDRETIIKGLMQCNHLSLREKQQGGYFFMQSNLWATVSLYGSVDVDKKTIVPRIAFEYIGKDWIFADSIWITNGTGTDCQSGKVEFERKVDNKLSKNEVYCRERAHLSLVGKARDCLEFLIKNKEAEVGFLSKEIPKGYGVGTRHFPEQLKDLYEAIQVIERHFNNP